MKRLVSFFLILLLSLSLAGTSMLAQKPVEQTRGEQVRLESDKLSPKLNFAASQHEIIGILIDQGYFDAIPEEFEKILQLGLTGPEEELVVRSAWQIVDRLRDARQFGLAHQVVDETLKRTRANENRFSLLMMRAKIFQDQKLLKQAVQAYKEAQELQRPK